MKIIHGLCFLFLILVISAKPGAGQNSTCETADPFCTGTLYNFPAGVNAGNGQPGPCYNCLLTTPNPAWYYMKVLNSGNIIISMHSEPSRDIDFCCWGPFTSQNACTQLTCNKVVDCSYSPYAQETCTIPNGITGQYYILIITNFSNLPCNIIFSQTGGSGSTDCSILPPPADNNSPICASQTLLLTASSISNASYHWWGPNNFISDVQNPTIPNAQPVNSGTYFLTITLNGQPSSDTSETVAYVYKPIANAGNDTSIANGVFANLHGNCAGGSGHYQWHWSPENLLVDPLVQNPQTVNLFQTTNFKLLVTDDSASCQSEDYVNVNIIGGPLGVTAVATPSAICYGATSQLQATGFGGAGNYTFAWSGPNGFSSTLPNPVVQPDITTTYNVTVYDGYNSSSGTVTVTVIPLPVADAGPDKPIPNGTYTFLSGSVVNGTNNYFYSWSPQSMLINPNIHNPQTVNLSATQVYSLVVTDLVTNCVNNNLANVTIEVTGGPLAANPVATPDWICRGDTTQLHAAAGGGNEGYYTYTWTSNPPGFTSTEPDPFATPVENTIYTVSVNDQYNTVTGNTLVSMYDDPVIYIGPRDSTVCIYDTIQLDAGNPGSAYLWSNGLTSRQILVGSAGITYDLQTYWVDVTNEHGCSKSDTINIIFSFSACVGIGEKASEKVFTFYPNPAHSGLTLEGNGINEPVRFTLMSVLGTPVMTMPLETMPNGSIKMSIELPSIPKGIYFIAISGNSLNEIHKLIIE